MAESEAIQSIIKGWRLAPTIPIASAVLSVAKQMSAADHDPSMLIAAFVDLTEAE